MADIHGDRKRPYRRRVTCSECNKTVDSDYKDRHAKSQHKGKIVKFTEKCEESQLKLSYFGISITSENTDDSSHGLEVSDPQCSHSVDSSSTAADQQMKEEPSAAASSEVNLVVSDGHNSQISTHVASTPSPEIIVPLAVCTSEQEQLPYHDFHEGPKQPILKKYNLHKFGSEEFQRDSQPEWLKKYPWLSYSIEKQEATCYA